MRKFVPLLAMFAIAACDLSTAPETRNGSSGLAQIAQWNASVARVGTASAISGSLVVREYGSYGEAEISITGGLPTRAYQWRIFRGNCAATAAADLALHSTIQAYTDLVTDASGAASMTRTLGGALNSPQGVYSVRIRLGTTTTNWNGTSPIACGDLQRS